MKTQITRAEVEQWLQNPTVETGLEILRRQKPNIKVFSIESIKKKLCYIAGINPSSITPDPSPITPDPSPITHHPSPITHHPSPVTTPDFIEQIVKEHARLVTLRSMLDVQRKALGIANTPEIVKQRKTLTASIHQHSQRIEMLYQAKEDYYNKKIIPNLETLGIELPKPPTPPITHHPSPITHHASPKENVRLKTLRDAQRRDQNMLDYQQGSKGPEPNPMPEGKKRFSIIARMQKRLKEIETLSNE